MNIVEIDPKFPVMISKVAVESFRVKPQTWVGYINTVVAARADENTDFLNSMFREWALKHIEPIDKTGKVISFTVTDLLQIPARYGFKFQKLRNENVNKPGEIVKDGNGIDTPCVFKLGNPLSIGVTNTGEEAPKITELEFLVRTIGDIEPMMLMSSNVDQTDALIRNCATPLGSSVTLLRLTEQAMNSITIEDGIKIMNEVLPRFFV